MASADRYPGRKKGLPNITPEQIATIKRMVLTGRSTLEIVADVGVSSTSVRRIASTINGPDHPEGPAIRAALAKQGATVASVASDLGLSIWTVWKYGKREDLVESSADSSMKSRLLREIATNGPYPSVLALMAAIRTRNDNYGTHEVTHLLYSLHRQAAIKYHVRKEGTTQYLEAIEVTPRGREIVALDRRATELAKLPALGGVQSPTERATVPPWETRGPTASNGMPVNPYKATGTRDDLRGIPSRTVGGPIEVVRPVVEDADLAPDVTEPPEPTATPIETPEPVYPVLAALRERQAKRLAAANAAARYAEAAAILDAIDPAEAERLLGRAASAEGEPFSAIEIEYLRFADNGKA